MEVVLGPLVQNLAVEIAGLVIVAVLAFVLAVGLAGNDVTAGQVGRLCDVGAELVSEGVGRIVGVHAGISVGPESTGEVDGGIALRTVDGDLVEVATGAMVLRIAVEELQQAFRRVFNTRYHGIRGEGGLLDIVVLVFRGPHGQLRAWGRESEARPS